MKRKINTEGIVKDTSLAVPAVTDAEVPSYVYGPGYRLDLGKSSDILSELGRELVEQGKVNFTPLFEKKYPSLNLAVRPPALGFFTRREYPADSKRAKTLSKFSKGDTSFIADKDFERYEKENLLDLIQKPQILYNVNRFENKEDNLEVLNHELRHAALNYLRDKYSKRLPDELYLPQTGVKGDPKNLLNLRMGRNFEETLMDYIDFVRHQNAKKMFEEEGYQDITDATAFQEQTQKVMEKLGPERIKKYKKVYSTLSKIAEQELRNLENIQKKEYDDEEELRDASKDDLAPKSFMQKMLGIFKSQGGLMTDTNIPSWLARALNPDTPMTDDNETMKTIDVEMDGKMYLVPTIRMGEDGKLYKLTDKEAVDKAKELGDALLVPEGLNPTEFSKALSNIVPQRKARGGEIMARPMTEAQAAPQGNAPKAGNPAALMQPPPVPKPSTAPGADPRDEAIQLVMQQSQKKDLAPTADGTGEPMNLTNITPLAQQPQMPAPQQPELGSAEMPMMAKRGGTKEDKEGMSVVIGLGSSPMPAYEEASMGTPKDPPPGATADEVADDQHVLMSEGELVVPANVVRYHGLGTYEGLRREALMGLAEMEKSGQINYDTGVKKAQAGLMLQPFQPKSSQDPLINDPYQTGNMPAGNMFRYPPIGINPPMPGLAYTPVVNPNLPIVATNVGSYLENINPKEEDKDKDGVEEVEAPKVVTTPAALVKPDPRDDSTSPQSMAQARADMDKSYDMAVAKAVAAGMTTDEEILNFIKEGKHMTGGFLQSISKALFNNIKRPDGTRPVDAAINRFRRSGSKQYTLDRSKKDPDEVKVIDEDSFPGEEVNAQTQQILAQQAEEPYTPYRDEDYGAPIKPKPQEPTVVKNVLGRDRDEPMGTTIRTEKDAPRGVTITTDDTKTNESGQRGVITSVQAGTKEDKEPAKSCVIATHGVANGGFSPMEKAKAEIWCERTYHGKWYGEAFRRGYRYLASKHVEQDTASQFYQEFKDFVAFGRGLKKGLKLRLNYYFRTVQFFITGLFVSKDI